MCKDFSRTKDQINYSTDLTLFDNGGGFVIYSDTSRKELDCDYAVW